MAIFSKPIEKLLQQHLAYLERKAAKEETPKIQVDEVASEIASFYESVRNLIDYHESHLLRKNAIGRALRRRIFLKDLSGRDLAEPLIREVIRSGHLGNNTIPETKIEEVEKILELPDRLIGHLATTKHPKEEELTEWVLGITVCAIEEALAPPEKELMLAEVMLDTLKENLSIKGGTLSEEDTRILLFAAIQKSLLKVDTDQLHYRLFAFKYPTWGVGTTDVIQLVRELEHVKEVIVSYTKHPLLPSFLRLVSRYDIVFHTIGDLVFGGHDLQSPEEEIKVVYEERYKREKKRLSRLAFFSVISFFLSKIIVALAIEIPLDIHVFHHFSPIHTIANIIFPPFLMFLVVASIRLPSSRNLALVRHEVKAAIFEGERKTYVLQIPKKKSVTIQSIVHLAYLFIFLASLYVLTKLLLALGFSLPSIVVFVLFTSLVTATGVKIYNRAKEMSLEKERSGFLRFLLDLLTVPLTAIGRWAIAGLRRFNVLLIVTTLVIELPLQLFVEFVEHFNEFIRNKKEEID